ncbi:MAG: phosphatidate cytidylyltransferase, partial [Acidobacteria bacterium ACB2]|nr:phosphatidate cytidylyltransferase [Acidobacteria bacterium ACB2]
MEAPLKYQRELTALVLIPAVLAILVAGPVWAFALLVGLAAGLALVEFHRLLSGSGLAVPRAAGAALFVAALVATYLGSAPALVVVTGAALVLLPALVLFARPPVGVLLASSATAVFSTLYVSAGASAAVALRQIGWKPVLFLLAVVWAGDSAAYYAGRRWGRRKLAPVVSPKKSWEGFWGQIAGGALAGSGAGALA